MPYRQLTLEQRYQIQAGLEAGNSYSQVAAVAGCHKSTISREVRRCKAGLYQAKRAHEQALARRRHAAKATKKHGWLYRTVREMLGKPMTPEAIANRITLETGEKHISHESIYRWVYEDWQRGGELHKHLVRAYKPYRKRYGVYDRRGRIPGRRMIDERPAIVEERSRLGDWEGDTVHGHGGHVVTVVDRASRYVEARKVKRRTRAEVTKRLIDILKGHSAHTLTLDNGVEFHGHREIALKAKVDVFFAEPYSSWQRGSNENANGVFRRFAPKGSNFARLTPQRLRRIVDWMNNRPLKCLGWRTPYEVHYGVSVALVT
jgi:IS30 family transposase